MAEIKALGGDGGVIVVTPKGEHGLFVQHTAACTAAWPTPAAAASPSIGDER